MPIYCYRTKDGTITERVFPIGKAPRRVKINGRFAARDLLAEHGTITGGEHGYPCESDSLGCRVDQVPEMKDFYRSHGVSVDFKSSDGRMAQLVFESPGHRRQVMKAAGVNDRNSYTGY